jgi:hypothetical protein
VDSWLGSREPVYRTSCASLLWRWGRASLFIRTDPQIASRFESAALPSWTASEDLRSFLAGFVEKMDVHDLPFLPLEFECRMYFFTVSAVP